MRPFVDTLIPANKALSWLFNILVVFAGAFLIAVAAQISIPLPFTPVPATLQTFAVLLIGATFGAKRGMATVITYITEGCLGFPVFAGGVAGVANLLGPRGGYLLGFILGAFLIGYIFQKIEKKNLIKLFLSFLVADLIILVCGGLWLSFFVGTTQAYLLGIAPFFLSSLTKITLLTLLFSRKKAS